MARFVRFRPGKREPLGPIEPRLSLNGRREILGTAVEVGGKEVVVTQEGFQGKEKEKMEVRGVRGRPLRRPGLLPLVPP